MDPHRILDDNEVIKSSLVALKNATGIPVTMYAEVTDNSKMQINNWVGLRTPALQNLTVESGGGCRWSRVGHAPPGGCQ